MIETTISVQATKVCHLNLASRATDEFLKKKLSNFMPNDPLKELEEWMEKNVQVSESSGFEYIGYDSLLAKIAEMREVDI